MNETMIECQNLVKIYKTKDLEVLALQGLDMKVRSGELMAIIGSSGSGKSTLLNMLGGLDRPSAGTLLVDGQEVFKFTDVQLDQYRRSTVGFIWQNNSRNLIPYLSARNNIMMPMTEPSRRKREQWADELLNMTGLYKRRHHRLTELSGGEQQRIAIAISLANHPKLLLADEPTGAVDSATTDLVLDMFRKFNEELKLTIVIVTHDISLSKKVDRIVSIRDGKVSSEFMHKRFYAKELTSLKDLDDDEDSHIEMVVLDKTGRLQLPREYVEDLQSQGHDRLMVTKENGHILLKTINKE